MLNRIRQAVSGSRASLTSEEPPDQVRTGPSVQNTSGKVQRIGLAYVEELGGTTLHYAMVLEGGQRLEFCVHWADARTFCNDLALTIPGDFVYIGIKRAEHDRLWLMSFRNIAL